MASYLWAKRAASFLRVSVPFRSFATVLKDLKYAESHEWVKVDGGDIAVVGITDHAQDHMGDVVYVELPKVGTQVKQGKSFGSAECNKTVIEINSPISGNIVQVNEEVRDSPGLVNASPFEKGWMIKVEMKDAEELKSLMNADHYSKFCQEEQDRDH